MKPQLTVEDLDALAGCTVVEQRSALRGASLSVEVQHLAADRRFLHDVLAGTVDLDESVQLRLLEEYAGEEDSSVLTWLCYRECTTTRTRLRLLELGSEMASCLLATLLPLGLEVQLEILRRYPRLGVLLASRLTLEPGAQAFLAQACPEGHRALAQNPGVVWTGEMPARFVFEHNPHLFAELTGSDPAACDLVSGWNQSVDDLVEALRLVSR